MIDTSETFSMVFLRFLQAQSLTQSAIAGIVHVPHPEITRVKKGQREFKANHLILIAEYLQMPLGTLVLAAMKFIENQAVGGDRLAGFIESVIAETELVLHQKRRKRAEARSLIESEAA